MKKIGLSTLIVLIAFISSSNLFAQIGLHPQAVFLNQRNRVSNLKILNMNNQKKEISIDIKFGYAEYDSVGNFTLIHGDTLPEAKWSAEPFVRVFPKKLILNGREEQVIKFMLGNMSDMPDGTYYARIHLLSKNPPEEIDTTYSEDKITAKLDVHFTLISALIVEKGQINCDIDVKPGNVFVDSANVNFLVSINKNGNSPFLGTTEVEVFDENDESIAKTKQLTPYYVDSKRAFKFDKNLFSEAKYRVELQMSNEHKDVPDDFKIPFNPIKESFIVDLEGKFK